MSHLSEELARQMEIKEINQVVLSDRSGISQGQISKWLRAEQTSINEEQLNLLAAALTDNAEDHAALVRAHLLDECFGYGSELVEVTIKSASEIKDRPRPRSRREQAIEILRAESVRDRDLADLLISLASYVEPSSTAGAHASAIFEAAFAEAKKPQPPSGPTTYKTPRRTKKPTPPKPS